MTFRILIFLIFLSSSLKVSSQTDTVYFSSTADTVLYSYKFFQPDTTFDIYILKKHPIDTTQLISSFSVKSTKTLKPYTNLSVDTIKKYHLTYDGIRIDPYNSKDFKITIKKSKPTKIDQREAGENYEYIFKTLLTVKIKCKGKTFYNKSFEYMYKQFNREDILDKKEIIQLSAWKRGGKYFINCSIREEHILKCDNNFFSFKTKGYIFVL
jgi:hypothetical protein